MIPLIANNEDKLIYQCLFMFNSISCHVVEPVYNNTSLSIGSGNVIFRWSCLMRTLNFFYES